MAGPQLPILGSFILLFLVGRFRHLTSAISMSPVSVGDICNTGETPVLSTLLGFGRASRRNDVHTG